VRNNFVECELQLLPSSMVRRIHPERKSRWIKRTILACPFVLLNIPIVNPFPVFICIPSKYITSKSERPFNRLRWLEQSRGREDDSDDASDNMNEGVDRVEREDSPMKSAIKSSSMDLTDRFKYKVFSYLPSWVLPCVMPCITSFVFCIYFYR
jgi:hypothetical protein